MGSLESLDYAQFPADAATVTVHDVRAAYEQGLRDASPIKVTDMDPDVLVEEIMATAVKPTWRNQLDVRHIVTQAIHKVVQPKPRGEK